MQQSKVSTSAESPRSTTGVAVTAKPTVRIEEVIGAADVSAQALRCKEDIDRLFSFYAKLQGSGVSTGAPPTLELEEAFHMLGDFGVLVRCAPRWSRWRRDALGRRAGRRHPPRGAASCLLSSGELRELGRHGCVLPLGHQMSFLRSALRIGTTYTHQPPPSHPPASSMSRRARARVPRRQARQRSCCRGMQCAQPSRRRLSLIHI